jgi:hypothetical protein
VPSADAFVVVEEQETGDLIGFTGSPLGERDARREEAIRGAREPSAGRGEDAESDTDEDKQPSYGGSGSNTDDEDQSMPEDRGLFGTYNPGFIETFQEAGVTLLVTGPSTTTTDHRQMMKETSWQANGCLTVDEKCTQNLSMIWKGKATCRTTITSTGRLRARRKGSA